MPGPAPLPIELCEEDRCELESWTRHKAASARLYIRAKIVLLAAEGETNSAIARKLDYARDRVVDWRRRFAAEGMDGLRDRSRSGRPRSFSP